jgi:hypothetical protein
VLSAIRGPLGIHCGANRRFWFEDVEPYLEVPLELLENIKKVKQQEFEILAAGMPSLPAGDRKPRSFRGLS